MVHAIYVALQRKKLKSDQRAAAVDLSPKSGQTGESFAFQGCTRRSNALYDEQNEDKRKPSDGEQARHQAFGRLSDG
ncbi:hypothetical protein LJR220_000909 [Bradyrhizobium sp. LjRoot220]|uniref:hypothetical protein n=1 Tax=Bradyrhizobium sp. LjRoot220 TaxID=3342284 RepID=UPI003ECFC9E0